jgi:hypothetical protein
VLPQSNTPIIDLRLKISLPENVKEVRFDLYDASNLSPEDLIKLQEDVPESGADASVVQEEVDDDQLQFPGYEMQSEDREQNPQDDRILEFEAKDTPVASPSARRRPSSPKEPDEHNPPNAAVSMLDHNRSHSTLMKVSSVSGSKLLTVEKLNSARNSHALSRDPFRLEQEAEKLSPAPSKDLQEVQKSPFEKA